MPTIEELQAQCDNLQPRLRAVEKDQTAVMTEIIDAAVAANASPALIVAAKAAALATKNTARSFHIVAEMIAEDVGVTLQSSPGDKS